VQPSWFDSMYSSKKHPDGTYWVDRDGGSIERPTWCPGDTIRIRYLIHTDHNGVFQWESQLASAGYEREESFQRITERISVNNYNRKVTRPDGTNETVMLANYFAAEDGQTPIPGGTCKDGSSWSNLKDRCMSGMFAETTLDLPASMSPGDTVLRWRWFGSTDTDGKPVDGDSERSQFVSCKDVIIGSAAECGGHFVA